VRSSPSLLGRRDLLSVPPASCSPSRRRRSVIVVAAEEGGCDQVAGALAASLDEIGVETTFLGNEADARQIARTVVLERADALELLLGRTGGVLLLRELLRELIEVGRRDVSIVVHRIP
jgi:hypothetical protein